jgi:hypothetical protein
MSGHDLDTLAAALGRPASSLSAFADLPAADLALLVEAIDAARERRRRELDDAFARALPFAPARRLVLGLLRRGDR